MKTITNFPLNGFLRLSQVLSIIPISKSAWYAGIAAGRFPKPVSLGPRTAAWRKADIEGLVEKLNSQHTDN